MSQLTKALDLLEEACDADPDDARRYARKALFTLPGSDENPTPDGIETVRQRLDAALEASNDPIRPVREAYLKLEAIHDEEFAVERQVDVPIPEDTWKKIVEQARENGERRRPRTAFWEAYNQHVQLHPNIVVEGESKGPEDIFDVLPDLDGVQDEDDDDDGGGGRGTKRVIRGP